MMDLYIEANSVSFRYFLSYFRLFIFYHTILGIKENIRCLFCKFLKLIF